MKYGSLLMQLVLLLYLAEPTIAATADHWNSGKNAFETGDYAAALSHFESARDDGREGPAVHYNIAVSQFKLGRLGVAQETFLMIARRFASMRGLAEYNLGLISRRLDRADEARAHFLRAYELSANNETIRILASRRLRELEPDTWIASRWRGVMGVRAGYDDNVALRDELGLPANTSAASPMADIFAAIEGPWTGQSGFQLDASAYVLKYFDADDFDQTQFQGGAFYFWQRDGWRVRLGAHLSAGTFGGDAFDRKAGGQARIVRQLGRESLIDLRYMFEKVSNADSSFAGIDGRRHQFDVQYLWYRDSHRVRLRYQLEVNDRKDPGVSPHRNRFALDYRFQPDEGIGYEGSIDIRDSEYDELAMSRSEERLTVRAALTYMLLNNWQVILELRHSDNDSTDDIFSYERAQLTLGATRLF